MSERGRFERSYREEKEIILSAIDCSVEGTRAVYASSPLTSGLRLYELMEEQGVTRRSELGVALEPARIKERVWNLNRESADSLTRHVRRHVDADTVVISPAPLHVPGWSQPEYNAFWTELISTRIDAVWFNDAWQYSTGCAHEFAAKVEAGLPGYDSRGEPFPDDRGIELLLSAIAELESRGFDPEGLRAARERVTAVV